MAKIKILVMDVDGTLTDGKIYIGQEGELAKGFSVKDGCGILLVLPELGIIPVIITARESRILENRCHELSIKELYQGANDKIVILRTVAEKYGIGFDSFAYVGDDLPDIPCMEVVRKAGGLVLCPADAIQEIKELAHYVSGYKAGEGAIRDCINYLNYVNREISLEARIEKAIRLILNGQYEDKVEGTLQDGSSYSIQNYMTKKESECVIETHRLHVDIQYMIEGREEFKTFTTNCLTYMGTSDNKTDTEYWNDGLVSSHSILVPGSLIVVMNNQPHKGAIACGKSERVKKLVCKIAV